MIVKNGQIYLFDEESKKVLTENEARILSKKLTDAANQITTEHEQKIAFSVIRLVETLNIDNDCDWCNVMQIIFNGIGSRQRKKASSVVKDFAEALGE